MPDVVFRVPLDLLLLGSSMMQSPASFPDLSIILPFHNEASLVRELLQRLMPIVDSLGKTVEIICIDDGSTDNTFKLLTHEHTVDPRIKPVRLARNFGKESALTCGLRLSTGRAAILMDSDLQHPPETIPALIKAWENGARMVYAIRKNRDTDGFLRTAFSKTFYLIFKHIAEIRLPEGAGDFRLLDRVVIDAVNQMDERTRFMKGLMTWVGFESAFVTFTVERRRAGHSNWSFKRLLHFAFDGIFSFSTVPLRIWTWCGALISAFSLAYGAFLTVKTLIWGVDVPGYASLMVGLMFLGGIQLLSLGIIGEYLARVYTEVKGRPLYLIADKQGFPSQTEN